VAIIAARLLKNNWLVQIADYGSAPGLGRIRFRTNPEYKQEDDQKFEKRLHKKWPGQSKWK
jgi:hypothetical protein